MQPNFVKTNVKLYLLARRSCVAEMGREVRGLTPQPRRKLACGY